MASQHFGTSTKIAPILGKSTSFFLSRFFSQSFTNHRTAGEGGGHFFNSSLPFPPASQTRRHQLGDYLRELTSAHRQQPDSNRELLISERKSLTTKLRALYYAYCKEIPLLLIFHNRWIFGDTFGRIKSNQEQQVTNCFFVFFTDSVMKLMVSLNTPKTDIFHIF